VTRRTRRSVAGSVMVVLALVIGAVILTALHADGRERSKADTNDGGAWLLKRDAGYVGHVNRQVGEITAAVSVSDPGSDYDVDQAQGTIVVHDRTKGTVTVVDDSVERVANPAGVKVGSDVEVHAIDGGALLVDDASMKVWKLTREQLLSAGSTDQVDPVLEGGGRTLAAVTPDGHAALVDQKAGDVVFLRPDGSIAKSGKADLSDDTASVTTLGPDRAVFADTDGDVTVASAGGKATPLGIDVLGNDGQPKALALQQPGPAADHVVAVTTDGKVVAIPLGGGDGQEAVDIGQLGGIDPVAPIVYGGCVFAISTKPATFSQWCGDGADKDGKPRFKQVQTLPLDGAGSELRLRLVNGWVWINDVDTGAAWVTSPQQRVDRIQDWGNILSQLTDDSNDDDTDQQGGNVVNEVNPDDPNAQIVQSDQIDQTGPNKPPIARDDQAETRVDRPIDVDVLANDTDPNGDVLVVTAVQPAGSDAQIAIAPDGRSVQVSPNAGFTGTVNFGYTITDGRDGTAAANVAVQVAPADGRANRPPEAHNDIASTRRGRPTTFDVLANDTDPDGDALVLDSIALKDPGSAAGQIVPDPSGEVVFTPDPNTTQERIELTYTVSDDFGATDQGTVVVSVRLADANNEPDARNDAAVTVVGKPVRLNVLANDTRCSSPSSPRWCARPTVPRRPSTCR
jgi:large repetitive protein